MNIARGLRCASEHTVLIAKRGKKALKFDVETQLRVVEPIYHASYSMLQKVIEVYSDLVLADEGSMKRDFENLTFLNDQVSKFLTRALTKSEERSAAPIHLLFVCRSLEQIGILSQKMMEDMAFISESEDSEEDQLT